MYVQLTVSHHRSNYSEEKALGMTYWINTQLSILSMQIEIEVLHLPLDFRKAQWKTWYMHPFPPCYPPPLKGWQLHHSESKFWSQYLAAQRYFFFFFFLTEQRKSGILQTSQNSLYFPCCLCSLCCYPLKAQYDPPTLCCYFQYEISIQGLLDASQCLFSTPPTRFSLNARQIEHFRNWHFSQSICEYHAPC